MTNEVIDRAHILSRRIKEEVRLPFKYQYGNKIVDEPQNLTDQALEDNDLNYDPDNGETYKYNFDDGYQYYYNTKPVIAGAKKNSPPQEEE